MCEASRGGCLGVHQVGQGPRLGARPGVQGDGGHDPAPRGSVPRPWEQHWGIHLASRQHAEEGGGRGLNERQPGLHQDQSQPGWPGQLC